MRYTLCCALMALAGLTQAHAETLTVSDGDFENWTFTGLVSANAQGNASLVGGGNPGACIEVATYTPHFGDWGWGVAVKDDLTWDFAARGPIGAVRMDIDMNAVDSVNQGQGLYIVVIQDGRMYGGPIEPSITGSDDFWHRLSVGPLPAESFAEVSHVEREQWNTDSHPDFSASGPEAQFGFIAGNHNSGVITHLYDNWQLTIVPEPGVFGLVFAGLLSLLTWRRQ